MNRPPSILVDTGFEVDQNGVLTEIVIPSVVTTLDPPKKIVFSGTTLNWMPSAAAALEEFVAPNCTTSPQNMFSGYAKLTSISMANIETFTSTSAGAFYGCSSLVSVSLPSLKTINNASKHTTPGGAFYGCTGLTSVSLPALTSIACIIAGDNAPCGTFYGCTGLTSISLPALTTLKCGSNSYSTSLCGAFYGCTGLTSVSLPALTTIERGATDMGTCGTFYNCTGLQSALLPSLTTCQDNTTKHATFGNCTSLQTVQLGSEGYPVTSLGQYMFKNCTQSNLTITIYTADGNALANSPFGATNATIIWEEA